MWGTVSAAIPVSARRIIAARVLMRDEQASGPRVERPTTIVGFIFPDAETTGEILEFQHRDFGVQYAIIQLATGVELTKGLRFRIRRGDRIVGTGQVIQVLE